MGAQKIEVVEYINKNSEKVYALSYRDFYCPIRMDRVMDTSRRIKLKETPIGLKYDDGGYSWNDGEYSGREVSESTKELFYKTAIEQVEGYRDVLSDYIEKNKRWISDCYQRYLDKYSYKGKGGVHTTAGTQTTTKGTSKGTTTMNETTLDMSILKELKDAIASLNKVRNTSPLEEKLLEAVIERTKEIATAELESELKENLDKFIRETYGALPKRLEIKVAERQTRTIAGLFHEKFEDILKMVANDIPVMLTGSAGTGKNFTLEQVSEALGLEFYYTGAITQEYKLTGFIDAGGTFHETEFYKAFKNGGVFMLDEVDASSAETLVILNGAIANRYFDFPNGRIHANDNFRIVCAGNTFGTGADMVYVGRNVLDGATLDRFAVIRMDYDLRVEEKLCPDVEYHEFIKDMRRLVNNLNLRHIVGMRASINGYRALMAGLDKAFVIESIVMKGLGIDDLQTLVSNLSGSEPNTEWYTELRKYARRLAKGAR